MSGVPRADLDGYGRVTPREVLGAIERDVLSFEKRVHTFICERDPDLRESWLPSYLLPPRGIKRISYPQGH